MARGCLRESTILICTGVRIILYDIYNFESAMRLPAPLHAIILSGRHFPNALPLAIQSKRQPPDALIINRSIDRIVHERRRQQPALSCPTDPFQHVYKHLCIPHTRTTSRRISRRRHRRHAVPPTPTAAALVEPPLARMLRVVVTLLLHLLRRVASRGMPSLPATRGRDGWRGRKLALSAAAGAAAA